LQQPAFERVDRQGESLRPLVTGETERLHDQIYAEMTFHAAYQPLRALRTERWKYIRRFGDYERPVLANCDDSASKEILVENGWGEQHFPEEQLFDLLLDPAEARDLSGDPAHASLLEDLRARLLGWMEETSDPLLEGDIEPAPGTVSNDPSQGSPNDPLNVTHGQPAATL
jgi:N-sulfoglucosamine sulfohydrolase